MPTVQYSPCTISERFCVTDQFDPFTNSCGIMAASGGDGISLNSSSSSRKSAMSREELSFETRQVVIDFLGIVPTSQSLTASSGSSGSDKKKKVQKSDSSASGTSDSADGGELNRSAEGHFWTQKLASLPEVSLVSKYENLEKGESVLTPQASEDTAYTGLNDSQNNSSLLPPRANSGNVTVDVDSDSEEENTVDVIENGEGYDFEIQGAEMASSPATRPSSISLSGDAHQYGQTSQQGDGKNFQKSPSKFRGSPSKLRSQMTMNRDMLHRQCAIDRQISNISANSDTSLPPSEGSSLIASLRSGMSCHSNVMDISQVDMVDLGTLVRNNALPPLTLPLREELDKEKENLTKEYEGN